jgi:hypothetical protein
VFEAKRHLDSNVPTSPADATPDVALVGRLATDRYYSMDQVVAEALSTYARMVKTERRADGGDGAPRAVLARSGASGPASLEMAPWLREHLPQLTQQHLQRAGIGTEAKR